MKEVRGGAAPAEVLQVFGREYCPDFYAYFLPQRRHRRGPAAPAKDCADPEGRGFHPEGV